ncbi:pheromone binding protein [Rhyzopertha dominica]|uniref:Pheromone-binding protein 2 n=1 Tax=Rhyzopertha dominica TaxID=92692 RepID=A0A0X8T8T2_RHYDO|nr:pheromone-binding protein 2 [Rhyzopertha dominica]KAI7815680.1 pheromone binding protein [Rhyzopertha dominica]
MFKVGLVCVLIFMVLPPKARTMSDEMEELIAMLHNTCQEKSGVADDILARGMAKEFPDDQNFKCYIKCFMAEMAVIDDDGIIDVDAAVALLPDDIRPKLEGPMRKCGSKTGVDACDNAFLTYKCIHDENPQDYFLV